MTNIHWLLHLSALIVCSAAFFRYVPRYEEQTYD